MEYLTNFNNDFEISEFEYSSILYIVFSYIYISNLNISTIYSQTSINPFSNITTLFINNLLYLYFSITCYAI